MNALPSNVTLAILAGGEASRMGQAKAHLTIDRQPILQYLLWHLNWPGPTLLVTAPGRENPPGASLFTHEVIDPVAGQGPWRGLLTALHHCTTPLLLIASVDMPAIRPIHLHWLIDTLEARPSALGLLPVRETESGPQIEPFPSIHRLCARDAIAAHFAAGKRSIYSLSRLPDFMTAPVSADWDSLVWTNLNTPQDLAAWKTP